jgi:hypothetical protein
MSPPRLGLSFSAYHDESARSELDDVQVHRSPATGALIAGVQ